MKPPSQRELAMIQQGRPMEAAFLSLLEAACPMLDPNSSQAAEMRKLFFAGARACIHHESLATSSRDHSARVVAIHLELEDFSRVLFDNLPTRGNG